MICYLTVKGKFSYRGIKSAKPHKDGVCPRQGFGPQEFLKTESEAGRMDGWMAGWVCDVFEDGEKGP